jgi:hypothetical protein
MDGCKLFDSMSFSPVCFILVVRYQYVIDISAICDYLLLFLGLDIFISMCCI